MLVPADNIVGFAVFLIVAASIALIGPSFSSSASRSSPEKSSPVTFAAVSRKPRTESVIRIGNLCPPNLTTAALRARTELSLLTIEPWLAVPRAVRRIQLVPFSAVMIGYNRT